MPDSKALKLFRCQELLSLYDDGKLNDVLEQYRRTFRDRNLLGRGGDSSAFRYGEDQVLKICPKSINYFKHTDHHSAEKFKEHINSLSIFFLPIREILHENDDFFIYTQDMCRVLSNSTLSPFVVISVFQIIQYFLKTDILMTDLAPRNVGIRNGLVVLFDYHGLRPLRQFNDSARKNGWWTRIVRNLTRFISYLYAPDRASAYGLMMQTCTPDNIAKLKSEGHLPNAFIDLLYYLQKNNRLARLSVISEYLEKCIGEIMKGANLTEQQERRIDEVRKYCTLTVKPYFFASSNAVENGKDSD